MALVLGLRIVRRAVGVYAAVMETHASHQQLLLHRRLVAELLQSQLVLPLPLGSAIKRFPIAVSVPDRQDFRD